MRVPLGLAREWSELLANPQRIPETTAAAATQIRAIVRQLSDTKRALSPLWTDRSLSRRLETLRAPFDDVKAAATTLGGSINTAFITAATEAAGRYHRAKGAPVDELRASMAISTRTKQTRESNAFTLARMLVPTGDMGLGERFKRIQEATDAARSASGQASLDALAGVTAALPTSLLVRIARQQTQTVDLATSNVRGSPVPLFLAGARVDENYPIGPTGGTAFNLTLLSYAGSLDMGLNIDAAAVEDPVLLRTLMEESFDELVVCGSASARRRRRRRRARRSRRRRPRRRSADGSGDRLWRVGQQRADVEQEISDFSSRHELTRHHLAQTSINDRKSLVDLFGVVRLRHLALQPCPPDQHSRTLVTVLLAQPPYRSSVTRLFQANGYFRHQTGTRG